jgi:hypothetical protein
MDRLSQSLLAVASGSASNAFVGFRTFNTTTLSSVRLYFTTIPLIKTGDLIIVTSSFSSSSPATPSASSTGYTTMFNTFTSGGGMQTTTFYKYATEDASGSSTDILISFPSFVNNMNVVVTVFRGYQYHSHTVAAQQSTVPDPPSIACSVNDLILATYQNDNGSSGPYPSEYIGAARLDVASQSSTVVAYRLAVSTSDDPPSISNSTNRVVGATIRCIPI